MRNRKGMVACAVVVALVVLENWLFQHHEGVPDFAVSSQDPVLTVPSKVMAFAKRHDPMKIGSNVEMLALAKAEGVENLWFHLETRVRMQSKKVERSERYFTLDCPEGVYPTMQMMMSIMAGRQLPPQPFDYSKTRIRVVQPEQMKKTPVATMAGMRER